jgi:hypothetical protein
MIRNILNYNPGVVANLSTQRRSQKIRNPPGSGYSPPTLIDNGNSEEKTRKSAAGLDCRG